MFGFTFKKVKLILEVPDYL